MKRKNLKKTFNKKTSFAFLLGIAASFSPLLVMGSCNNATSKKEDSSIEKIEPKVKNLAEELGKVTKTIKRKSVFSDYVFKDKKMTLSDFISNLGLSSPLLTGYENLKLIVNKDKGSSVVKIKIKGLSSEKNLELKITSFTTLEEYFKTLIDQLKSSTISFENKTQFLEKEYSQEKMNQEALENNLEIALPKNILDKDVELKITKRKNDANVQYSLSILGKKDSTTFEVTIEKFFKNFSDLKWPKLNGHQESYFITQDTEGHYLLDRKYSWSASLEKLFLMRNTLNFNPANNQFILNNGNNNWEFKGFINTNNKIDDLDYHWLARGYPFGWSYFTKVGIGEFNFEESVNREFNSILTNAQNISLSNSRFFGSIFFVSHLDPTETDYTKNVKSKIYKGAGDIFLMPGYEDNKLYNEDRTVYPSENEPNEQDMYLTTSRGMDIDAEKLIFVSNSGMISATDYNLNVLPNIEVQNLLSDSEKKKYYEVQRTNFNSLINQTYDQSSDYYSIDFISSTFKLLGDKGYTFMYWKNHNALSSRTNLAGLKDIYPDKKELYQVTLDKDFKIKENKKIDFPEITLSYEDYKRKEDSLQSWSSIDVKYLQIHDVFNKNIDKKDKWLKMWDDVTNVTASDVTNYFKTSIVEIGGKKYFYLADEKMTKILVLDNDYQVEKTIDIPMSAFKTLEGTDGHKRYITKMFKKGNNLILFSNYLETLVIDTAGNIIKEPKANYSSDLAKYRNTIFQNPYKNTEIFQLDENKYLAFMHKVNKDITVTADLKITKITAIVDADGQFAQE